MSETPTSHHMDTSNVYYDFKIDTMQKQLDSFKYLLEIYIASFAILAFNAAFQVLVTIVDWIFKCLNKRISNNQLDASRQANELQKNNGKKSQLYALSKLHRRRIFDSYIINHESLKHIEKYIIQHILAEVLLPNNFVNWNDIAGLEQAKKRLLDIVVFPFLRPALFKGLRAPSNGILLFGPLGTGKSLIARCVATKAKATFFDVSVFMVMSKWIGEEEKLVRVLFEVARLKSPSIIFIDDIDVLLTTRKDGEQESLRRIKTELLVQMDCIASDERILVLGSTNKPEIIDDSARRRFPKRVYISLPNLDARIQLLRQHMNNNSNMLKESDYSTLADMTKGFSGADILHFAKEASHGPLRDVITDIENVQEENIRPIKFEDFNEIKTEIMPTVSKSQMDSYREWSEKFGNNRI